MPQIISQIKDDLKVVSTLMFRETLCIIVLYLFSVMHYDVYAFRNKLWSGVRQGFFLHNFNSLTKINKNL